MYFRLAVAVACLAVPHVAGAQEWLNDGVSEMAGAFDSDFAQTVGVGLAVVLLLIAAVFRHFLAAAIIGLAFIAIAINAESVVDNLAGVFG